MSEVHMDMIFTPDKPGRTRGVLRVMQEGKVLHSDRIDIAAGKARSTFLSQLKGLLPAINIEPVQQYLLEEVRRASEPKAESRSQAPEELDVSRIVRPHLFHLPEVSGLLIPVAQARGLRRPEGKLVLCIQWASGKRECVDLAEYIEVGDDKRIWFCPTPTAPTPNTASRWSLAGRAKWLSGYTPDLKSLFSDLYDQFLEFLEFPGEEAFSVGATLALWTMLTYAYSAWPAVPYLSIGGPLGSGKSRVFDVLGLLVQNPLHSSNLTAPCLFRILHTQGGTVLLDEAERLGDRTPDVGELRSILLAGYKRGGQAHRMERYGDSFQSVAFDVFGPKAIAGTSNLPAALASRCIRIMMFRAGKTSLVPKRRIDPTNPVWVQLRDDLHAMALSYGTSFVKMADWQVDCADLNGRSLELWQPILAMARLVEDAGIGGLVEAVEKHAVKSLELSQDDIVPEVDEVLLRTLKQMSQDRSWGVTAGEVLKEANAVEPSLFSHYTARGVAAVFKRYGIKAHRSGGKRYFNATEDRWKAIEQSYGIDLGPTDDDGTGDSK